MEERSPELGQKVFAIEYDVHRSLRVGAHTPLMLAPRHTPEMVSPYSEPRFME